MDETLGKRIVSHRKHIGLTQDALAEKLGVTAQAVSKWENDQSCPDITMLPKLADIFDCTTDELLGREQKKAPAADASEPEFATPDQFTADAEPEPDVTLADFRTPGSIFALWMILTGLISVIGTFRGAQYELWHVAVCCAIFSFGILGFPGRFSLLRTGCFLGGGIFLFNLIREPSIADIDWTIPISAGIALLGLDLLIHQVRRKQNKSPFVSNGNFITHCTYNGESFDCTTSFGDQKHIITLPRLSAGKAEASFGEMTIDLSGCAEITDGCTLELNCSFGELELLIPKHCRVEPSISTNFASFDTKGTPDPDASVRIYVNGSTNFGNITFRYF